MRPFIASIENLIRENKIKLALFLVADFLRGKNEDLFNRCLLLQSNLKQTEQDYLGNILNHDTALQNLARTRQALINLLGEVGQMDFDDTTAIARANEMYNTYQEKELAIKPGKSNKAVVWGVAAIIVLLASTYILVNGGILKNNNIKESSELNVTEKLAKVQTLREEANRYSRQKEYQKSLELLDQAINLSSDNAELYNERADTRFMLGQIDMAYDDAQRSIVLNPAPPYAYVTLAQIATKRSDREGFYSNFEKALQKRWNGWDFQNIPGILEHKTEKEFQKLLDAYRH